jgi:putative mRNA 3-end processing factor
MQHTELLKITPSGLYCAVGDFYIDPWKPVERAVITHAHSDHARAGSQRYLTTVQGERLLRKRLGEGIRVVTVAHGEAISRGGVRVSLHPAGHVLGSVQVRVECRGEVWVVSGDYKLEEDLTCAPFEPVECHTFITEATFGLPVYRWPSWCTVVEDINQWWRGNRADGKASVLFAYSLGKAQRLLSSIDATIGPIYTHGAVEGINQEYRQLGVSLPATQSALQIKGRTDGPGSLIVAPPSAISTPWLRRFGAYRSGFASGWMLIRGTRRRRNVDTGFVISDHADWPGLLRAVAATRAERVLATHGYTSVLARTLGEQGYEAGVLETRFTGELAEESSAEETRTEGATA